MLIRIVIIEVYTHVKHRQAVHFTGVPLTVYAMPKFFLRIKIVVCFFKGGIGHF